jgi:hypothetical protein
MTSSPTFLLWVTLSEPLEGVCGQGVPHCTECLTGTNEGMESGCRRAPGQIRGVIRIRILKMGSRRMPGNGQA